MTPKTAIITCLILHIFSAVAFGESVPSVYRFQARDIMFVSHKNLLSLYETRHKEYAEKLNGKIRRDTKEYRNYAIETVSYQSEKVQNVLTRLLSSFDYGKVNHCLRVLTNKLKKQEDLARVTAIEIGDAYLDRAEIYIETMEHTMYKVNRKYSTLKREEQRCIIKLEGLKKLDHVIHDSDVVSCVKNIIKEVADTYTTSLHHIYRTSLNFENFQKTYQRNLSWQFIEKVIDPHKIATSRIVEMARKCLESTVTDKFWLFNTFRETKVDNTTILIAKNETKIANY